MKKIRICGLLCGLMIVFLAGCGGIPEHNYIGMTRAEVAAHLEKYAFRDRWSGNTFKMEVLQKQMYHKNYKNAAAVTADRVMMSADEWRCSFYPQRHWLLGWDGIFSKWHFVNLKFKDNRVVDQRNLRNYYWVYGHAGKSPYPDDPKNFHKVSENLYRSGQPDEDEFESLHTFNGIRSVLNLRENNSDQAEIAAINKKWNNAITLYEIPLDTGSITEDDLYKILTVIRDAPKPLLIHCWHGSDRTGCSVAAYRIVFENWSVEDAISELMKPEYGHHKNIYTNIPELLRKADWKKIRETILDKEK
ncbi:MAG: tyrosine-protein phosphatase [Lentisphaeria bacterium]|nr:tyrosine-protein phosphatase [Lentisphaeria bacterium]